MLCKNGTVAPTTLYSPSHYGPAATQMGHAKKTEEGEFIRYLDGFCAMPESTDVRSLIVPAARTR